MSLLELNNIGKSFQQGEITVRALDNINLTVNEGEFAALVGPSGSGKTTLLNIIGGLDLPSDGQILINETEITALKDSQLADFRLFKLGFIFQAYNLVPVLNAVENVELVMILQGRDKNQSRERAEHYLNLVGLNNAMQQRRPSALSGGQQQRVAVARALAAGPRIVLADEPTANLDSENATALLDIMHRLSQEEKTTFLFSTHDVRVMERAERIITLRDGKVESDKWPAKELVT